MLGNLMRLTKRKVILAAITVFLILLAFILNSLGTLYVTVDPLEEADIIVVLMGGAPRRILEGVDVYNEGYADRILMMQEVITSFDVLVDMCISIPMSAELNKHIAVELGVPSEAIDVLYDGVDSTKDEAILVRKFLEENEDINSIILITSPSHSTRAKKLMTKSFRKLDREITIISHPTSYETFQERKWWKDRSSTRQVVFETIKFIHYYFLEQFSF